MPNQWSYNEVLSDVGRSFASVILRNKELQRQRAEKESQRQTLQDYLDQLNQGGTYQAGDVSTNPINEEPFNFSNMVPNRSGQKSFRDMFSSPDTTTPQSFKDVVFNSGKGQRTESNFTPSSPEQKAQIAMKMSLLPGGNTVYDNYVQNQKLAQSQREKSQPKYTNFDQNNKDIAFDANSGRWKRVSTGQEVDPTELIKKEKPNYTHHLENNKNIAYNGNAGRWEDLRTGEKVDPNDYAPKIEVREKRSYDSALGKYKVTADTYTDGKLTKPGIPRYISPTERKGGVSYISKDAQSMFNNFDKERKELAGTHAMISTIGKTDDGDKDRYVLKNKNEQVYASYTADLLKQKNNEYIQTVKQSAPPKLLKWYDKMHEAYNGDPNTGEAFLKNFLDAYKSGEFKKTIKIKKGEQIETITDPGASETGYFREMYRAIYGSYPDPNILKNAGNDVEQDEEIIDEGEQ